MDMQFRGRACDTSELLATPVRPAVLRNRLFVLIRQFQRAIGRQQGRNEAIRILHEVLPCFGAYFAIAESPDREEHRRLLEEMRQTLERCSASDPKLMKTELAHALDGLVIHETAIRFRKFCDPAS
jgi:hypothetical protein